MLKNEMQNGLLQWGNRCHRQVVPWMTQLPVKNTFIEARDGQSKQDQMKGQGIEIMEAFADPVELLDTGHQICTGGCQEESMSMSMCCFQIWCMYIYIYIMFNPTLCHVLPPSATQICRYGLIWISSVAGEDARSDHRATSSTDCRSRTKLILLGQWPPQRDLQMQKTTCLFPYHVRDPGSRLDSAFLNIFAVNFNGFPGSVEIAPAIAPTLAPAPVPVTGAPGRNS